MIGIWDMVSDFSGFMAKAQVKLVFVSCIVDGRAMLLANPQLRQEGIEYFLKILGRSRKKYAEEAFGISQSAPIYSAIKQLEKYVGKKEES
jgi:hypothetical protein